MLALVGKSGSGKTTLVKCIYGLEDIAEGEIRMDGKKVLGPAFNLIPGHSEMQLVSQEFHVLENHTVEENISDKLIGVPDDVKHRRATQVLKLLELLPLRNTRTKFLSSGQKQRVAIARALAVMPKVLLLDEPFSNLDKILSAKLFAFVTKEVRNNMTAVILVTHHSEEALKHADKIVIIDDGRVVQKGKKWEVYYRPRNRRLAGLLGDFNLIRKEDLHKQSKITIATKLFLRPDRLKIVSERSFDIGARVINSVFNGRCHEILAETPAGNVILFYTDAAKLQGAMLYLKIKESFLPA